METLSHGTVIFGRGLWLAMLSWLQQGRDVTSKSEMQAFREYQLALPMPNCAVFYVERNARNQWNWERAGNFRV